MCTGLTHKSYWQFVFWYRLYWSTFPWFVSMVTAEKHQQELGSQTALGVPYMCWTSGDELIFTSWMPSQQLTSPIFWRYSVRAPTKELAVPTLVARNLLQFVQTLGYMLQLRGSNPVCCPLSTVRCPLSTVHCPPSTVHRPLSTVHCPLFAVRRPRSTVRRPLSTSIVHCPLSIVHCPPFATRRPPSTVHCLLYTVHCPLSTVRCPLSTVHCPPFAFHRLLSAVHRPLSISHSVRCGTIYILTAAGNSRARGIEVREAIHYKPKGRGFETRWGDSMFSIYLNLTAASGPSGFVKPLTEISFAHRDKNVSV
jgi:hypothetical protein